MRLDIFGLVVAIATPINADSLIASRLCIQSTYHTEQGSYSVDANDGCRPPGVPNINNVCFDWGNRRLHFNANGQNKHCMKWQTGQPISACQFAGSCSIDTFVEVPCTW